MPAWASLMTGLIAFELARTVPRAIVAAVLFFVTGFVSEALRVYGFGGDTLLAVLQTHGSESVDFLLANLRARFVFEYIVQLAILVAFVKAKETRLAGSRLAASLLSFGLLSTMAITMIPPARDAVRFVRQFPALQPAVLPVAGMDARDVDVVLLLGESTSRWHFQLYGYPYPTTPRLLARQADLVTLTDAVSTYSHTLQSVSSLMYRPSASGNSLNETLLGELKAGGVKTIWLSSQSAQGHWDSPIRVLAQEADKLRYLVNRDIALPRGLDYSLHWGKGFTADLDLADAVTEELAHEGAGAHMTVAHLTAGHMDYCRNISHEARRRFEDVTRGAAYFGDAIDRTGEVNCYDAAMTLVDEVVDRVIEAAKRRNRPTVVIFAPDHGEDPDGGTGHSSGAHSARHVEIPVVFYLNESARRVMPQQFGFLQDNRGKPFALPWLHESILDLFGLNEKFSADPSRSIVAQDFQPIRRTLFPDAGAMFYDELTPGDRKDYLSKARLALLDLRRSGQKAPLLYAHRNDSELALLESMQSFEGVEMDVVFDVTSGRFQIFHPPALPTGYTLERALEIAQARPGLKFWFDWKNAGGDNIQQAVSELERLDRRFAIKSRALVETSAFEGAGQTLLAEHGFRHSYYLDPTPEEMKGCAQSSTNPVCIQAATRASNQAAKMRADCVSFDRSLATLGEAILKISPDLKALTWDLTVDASRPGLARQLVQSPPVDVELVRLPSRFWR